ncbi:MAG: SDR family NAD(P)-dependent oxidoreductase, partial [Parvibaculum sp.]
MVETAIVAGVGPAQGLGAVLARRIAKDGLHVVVAGRTMEKLDAVAASIRAEGGAATPVVCDVTD